MNLSPSLPRGWLILATCWLAFHCRDAPSPETIAEGPQLVKLAAAALPEFRDDFPKDLLLTAIDRQLQWFAKGGPAAPWLLNGEPVGAGRMAASLRAFKEIWEQNSHRPGELRQRIAETFNVYQMHWNGRPDLLITGYHAPIYKGSTRPSERFSHPLYKLPDDLLRIRTSRFSPRMLRAGDGLRGDRVEARILPSRGEVVPYFSREEIDEQRALSGRNLELVYLDDYFRAFLFHVQGGGFVQLEDGRYLKLNFAGKNGHPYTSIGKALVAEGKIPEEEISVQAIAAYFQDHPKEVRRVCYLNQSYVFYRTDGRPVEALAPDDYPHGFLGFPVTTLRTIATDKRYFPGGALAFVTGSQRTRQGDAKPFSGFVIDQDTGGAIKGAHIDLFQGAGADAEERAGLLKDERGRLFFLLIKEDSETSRSLGR